MPVKHKRNDAENAPALVSKFRAHKPHFESLLLKRENYAPMDLPGRPNSVGQISAPPRATRSEKMLQHPMYVPSKNLKQETQTRDGHACSCPIPCSSDGRLELKVFGRIVALRK